MSELLIKNLQNKALYNHPVHAFTILQTHISWVILTGDYAYKIKKPVDFGFLDFATLEKRRYFCEKELRLNQILAPDIYLNVVTITGSETKPEINGTGKVIDYAIKMREFPQENLFDALLKRNALHEVHMVDVAHILAEFHRNTTEKCPDYAGTPEQIFEPVLQNFEQITPLLSDPKDMDALTQLQQWTEATHQRLIPIFNERKKNNFIRPCHGDVHPGNITLVKDKPVIFDCIEFNESLRWTDTMADLGFLLMDLYKKKQPGLARVLLNTYLLDSGDYLGLAVLPYYQVYRAIVRAKISLFEHRQHTENPEKAAQFFTRYRRFIQLASDFTKQTAPFLFITHGMSGSGKSTLATCLVEHMGLVQLCSDVERKRMAGLTATADSKSGLYSDLYTEENTTKTYQRLAELTTSILDSGYCVIVDATFQQRQQRQQFMTLANRLQVPFCIFYCHAPLEKLLEWIGERAMNASVSEANKAILIAQKEKFELLTSDEIHQSININTAAQMNPDMIIKAVEEKLAVLCTRKNNALRSRPD